MMAIEDKAYRGSLWLNKIIEVGVEAASSTSEKSPSGFTERAWVSEKAKAALPHTDHR
jgi:hypothetical protein